MAESAFAKTEHRDEHGTQFLQRKVSLQDNRGTAQLRILVDNRTAQLAQKPNNTGLPDTIKAGGESLSGGSMDHVRIHYNSSKPAQLNADSYSQGISPDQDKHFTNGAANVMQMVKSVNNLVGTSHLKPKGKGVTSWKAHHKKHSKVAWHKCSAKGCRKLATVGAHVRETGSAVKTPYRYIVPFCQHHNKRPAGTALLLKKGTKLVGVGKGNVVTSD